MKKKIYQHLYFQVLVAIAAGVALGNFLPETGVAMKPLGDGFIRLVKMIITPVIFYIMKMRALRKGTLKVSGMTV